MPVIGTAETDSVTEAPEIKGYAYIKGLTIPKYKEAYVVVQDGAFVAYKDSSLQGVLLTFPLVPWRFKADAVVDKKDICKHGEYVLQIFQGAEPFFLAFPTANQLAVWESHMKLVLDAISPVIFGVPLKLAFHKSKATKAPAIIVKLIDVLEKVKTKTKTKTITLSLISDFFFFC